MTASSNTGAARETSITISGGGVTKTIPINQDAGALINLTKIQQSPSGAIKNLYIDDVLISGNPPYPVSSTISIETNYISNRPASINFEISGDIVHDVAQAGTAYASIVLTGSGNGFVIAQKNVGEQIPQSSPAVIRVSLDSGRAVMVLFWNS